MAGGSGGGAGTGSFFANVFVHFMPVNHEGHGDSSDFAGNPKFKEKVRGFDSAAAAPKKAAPAAKSESWWSKFGGLGGGGKAKAPAMGG